MPATNSEAQDAFRRNVLAEMERQGLSIPQLASKAGVSFRGVYSVLKGDQGVTLDRGEAIAKALGVSLVELIGTGEKATSEATV